MIGRPPSSPATRFSVAVVAVFDASASEVGAVGEMAGMTRPELNVLIATGVDLAVVVSSPTCPVPFAPQQKRPLFPFDAQVWKSPAAKSSTPLAITSVGTKESPCAVPSCPELLEPQHNIEPVVSKPQLK